MQCGRGQAVDLTTEHRVSGGGATVEAEVARVQAAGGWIADGRVCDVIAVSRAFGDQEFKGSGMPGMLERGVRCALPSRQQCIYRVGQGEDTRYNSVFSRKLPVMAVLPPLLPLHIDWVMQFG